MYPFLCRIRIDRAIVLAPLLVLICAALPASVLLAQSDGSVIMSPADGASDPAMSKVDLVPVEISPATSSLEEPAFTGGEFSQREDSSGSAVEPGAITPGSAVPSPVIPASPVPTEPVATTTTITTSGPATVPSNPDTLIAVAIATLALTALVATGAFLMKTKTKSKKGDPCMRIQEELERKKAEYSSVREQVFVQATLIELLREKAKELVGNAKNRIKGKVVEVVKDEVRERMLKGGGVVRKAVELAEEVKGGYDDVTEKIEQVSRLLEALRVREGELAGGVARLESAYRVCVLSSVGAGAVTQGGMGLGATLDGSNVPSKKAVVFDSDGMLSHGLRFSDTYSSTFNVPLSAMTPFFEGPFKKCLVGAADLKEELDRGWLERWGWKGTVDELLAFWFLTGDTLDQEVFGTVIEIRKRGVIVILATNQEKYRTAYLSDKFGYEDVFDRVFSSAYVGHKKPTKEFFDEIMKYLNERDASITLGDVLFWDDDPENVAGAREYGFEAEVFADTQSYRAKMKKLGLC